jgi:hypothetical protein
MPFNVGVVSSTDVKGLNPALYNSFANKLPAGTVITYQHASGVYDANSKGQMKRAVRQLFAGNPNYDLAVALGGLVSARALSDYIDAVGLSLPFLALVGRAPNDGTSLWQNDNFIGGINLDTANQNTYRAKCVTDHYCVAVNNICLLYNSNSHMGARESDDWSFFGTVKKSSVVQTPGGYNGAQFANDFATLPANAKAVIVSADPFFTSKATDIVAAATTWAQPVCYPNEIYNNANPLAGKSMIYGPDLSTAYQSLGQKAADYLNANPRPPQMGLDSPHPGNPVYV